MASVLIVEDSEEMSQLVAEIVRELGYSTDVVTDGHSGLKAYTEGSYDIVLADIDMKPMDGLTFVRKLKEYDAHTVAVVMSGLSNLEHAIKAFRSGAIDFLEKPLNRKKLRATLHRAVELRRKLRIDDKRRQTTSPNRTLDEILVGISDSVKNLRQRVETIVASTTPVMIAGEPGTGKRTITAYLHHQGKSKDGPMIAIDAAEESGENLRIGLLGEDSQGGMWLDSAHGGTLVIHHIERIPPTIQDALINVVSRHAKSFRLICTSSYDLDELLERDELCESLYLKLCTVTVKLPPLRDNLADIPTLVRHFAGNASNQRFSPEEMVFTEDAIEVLCGYHWPRNFSELKEIVTRTVSASADAAITRDQLPLKLRDLKEWPDLATHVIAETRRYIRDLINATEKNEKEVAYILGIDDARLNDLISGKGDSRQILGQVLSAKIATRSPFSV